ncbi:uncharacterized protein BYT42DRAFT_588119 [Radiomyces spectabilis]|uniref:uncharacterized protein n=1 Tax=Radiomyces spectabilis TaxID=64574 RepID=UPI00221E9E8E|nr:uncharacterized protein BYT42DRAFT_588119 [Radiomyces spectabilis]KAI8365903.1 hypothetical protein BYT42DRAFT_588119 [Radiomyces spectabilis]
MVRPTIPTRLSEDYSLAWLNPVTLAIATLLPVVLKLRSAMRAMVQASQSHIEGVCMKIDMTANHMMATPLILKQQTIRFAETSMENTRRNLVLAVDILESSVVFLVGLYKSTYQCLLEFAVKGVLSAATHIVKPLQQAADVLAHGVDNIGNHLRQLLGDFSVQGTNAGDIILSNWTSAMENIQLKTSNWTTTDPLNHIMDIPFRSLKDGINEVSQKWVPPPYPSAPVPHMSKYCDATAMIRILDDAQKHLDTYFYVAIGILMGLLLFGTMLNLMLIRSRHRFISLVRRQMMNNAIYPSGHTERQWLVYDHACRKPFVSSFLCWNRPQPESAWPWFIDFMTHPISLYCLALGICGGLVIASLYLGVSRFLEGWQPTFSDRFQAWVNTTSEEVRHKLENQMSGQTEQINNWIQTTEFTLNNHTFGTMRDSALVINQTLTEVVQHISGFLENTLGNTILKKPARDVLDCLLLVKIENLQSGIEWVVS